MTLPFLSSVADAAEYVPDWSDLDRRKMIRLDRNESTAPLSPRVARILSDWVTSRGVFEYPEYRELIPAIAGYCGVPADWVLPTNGSDQAIDVTLRAFLTTGSTLLVARPEFVIFGHVAGIAGASVTGVPYGPDLSFPYTAFEAALATRPTVIAFINPNNPTGTAVDREFILKVAREHPDTPVVVDEAYFEFAGVTVVPDIAEHPNLIVLRTFSKAFAMAGLRVGYVIARPEVVQQLVKVRGPFDINTLAAVAATAQLDHPDEMRAYVAEQMTVVKPAVCDFLRGHGVEFWPGAANFVLIRPPDCDRVIDDLRSAGILVRRQKSPLLAGSFRASLGTRAEMNTFIDVFQKLVPRPSA
ncbi:pyridoxal phosphate-dependent aminotransferase [Actinoplanes sp. HUAS TT8]|uniref:pyridoxal phosphate-dependent aminotransferase n=1 Tax=Actinoplanes sp. HUAS TT8 TaxID=3447453 RepID=UPI003F5206DF